MSDVATKNSFVRAFAWARSHPKVSLAVCGLFLIAVAGTITFFILQKPQPEAQQVATPKPVKKKPVPVPKYYSALSGEQIASQAAATTPVTAIMIENSPDARPQSGLKDAEVVFEAIAEGGITRFLAIYQQHKPQLIGPVRSVRMYYVDWLTPFDASVAHVGGSAAALSTVRNGSYRDIDEFFNANSYWRSTDRYAPHNVYTSFAKLDALNAAKGYTSSNPKGFSRTDSTKAAQPTTTSIDVHISGALYDSHYDYDATTNLYSRSQNGAPHLDREAGQISPRVVVVMKIPMSTVLQDGYREDYADIGSGDATIFQDGTVQQVTWHKADQSSQITFTNTEGKDVPLARGQTWLTAIPADTGSVSWK